MTNKYFIKHHHSDYVVDGEGDFKGADVTEYITGILDMIEQFKKQNNTNNPYDRQRICAFNDATKIILDRLITEEQ